MSANKTMQWLKNWGKRQWDGWVRTMFIVIIGIAIGVSYTIAFQQYSEIAGNGRVVIQNTDLSATSNGNPVGLADGSGEGEISPQLTEIAEKIWMLESSRGKNNYSKCEVIGKINGIGYGIPGNGKYMCFDSHEEQMETLTKWLAKNIEQYGVEKSLCRYNTGNPTDSCSYLEKYKSLI